MKKFSKTQVVPVVLWVFLLFFLLLFSYERVFDEFEFITLDLRYKIRPPQKVLDEVVIIEIGDDTVDKLGDWPLPRNYHALLIKALSSAGAKSIVFDVFFSEEKKEDKAFADVIKKAGNVYLPYIFDLDKGNTAGKMLHASRYAEYIVGTLKDVCRGSGFINVDPDEDGNLRRIPAFLEYKGKPYPHIAVLAALNNLGYEFDKAEVIPGKAIIADGYKIPLDETSEMLINYPAVWGKAFRHYSYADIIQSYIAGAMGKEPTLDLSKFKDSVCFIGLTATASPDIHPSPLEPIYPGVGVNASVYNGLVLKKFLIRLNRWWNLFILLAMWLLTALVTSKVRKRFSFPAIFLIMTSFTAFSVFFCWSLGVWIDTFYPLVTIAAVYIIFVFKQYIGEAKRREIIEKELDIAKNIQQSFLPQELPQVGGLDVAAKMITAKQVGGDLYDMIPLHGEALGVMIGDVSGKGVPAALFMAKVVSEFKNAAKHGMVSEIVSEVNKQLLKGTSSNLFVTLTYMIFDTEEKKVYYASGGHLPVILIKPDGEIKLLDAREGMPLGLIESDFSEEETDYLPGSTFILYTDGVTEAMDPGGAMFGEDRLVELAKGLKGLPAREVVGAVHKEVAKFSGKALQHDDITVVVVKT